MSLIEFIHEGSRIRIQLNYALLLILFLGHFGIYIYDLWINQVHQEFQKVGLSQANQVVVNGGNIWWYQQTVNVKETI